MLTDFQKTVLVKMKNENLILCTTEGSNFKCWFEDLNGNMIMKIRKDTAQSLAGNKK